MSIPESTPYYVEVELKTDDPNERNYLVGFIAFAISIMKKESTHFRASLFEALRRNPVEDPNRTMLNIGLRMNEEEVARMDEQFPSALKLRVVHKKGVIDEEALDKFRSILEEVLGAEEFEIQELDNER